MNLNNGILKMDKQSVKGKVFSIMGLYEKFKSGQDLIDLLLENGAYVINSPWYVVETNNDEYPEEWTSCDYFIVGNKTKNAHEKKKYIKAQKADDEGYPIRILSEEQFLERFSLNQKLPLNQCHGFGDTPITKTTKAKRRRASKQIVEKKQKMTSQEVVIKQKSGYLLNFAAILIIMVLGGPILLTTMCTGTAAVAIPMVDNKLEESRKIAHDKKMSEEFKHTEAGQKVLIEIADVFLSEVESRCEDINWDFEEITQWAAKQADARKDYTSEGKRIAKIFIQTRPDKK